MDTAQVAQEPNQQNKPMPLESLDQLVQLLVLWHGNRMAQLNAAMEVPDDVQIEVTDHATGVTSILTADQLVGFRAGITVVKSLFEVLPLVVLEDEPVPADPVVVG